MNLLKIGAHAINLDRVAEIWDQGEPSVPGGKVVVYFGDHVATLEGEDADVIRAFVLEYSRQPRSARPGPVKVTADLSGHEVRPGGPG